MSDDTAKQLLIGRGGACRASSERHAMTGHRWGTYASARALAAGLHGPDSSASADEPEDRVKACRDDPSLAAQRPDRQFV